MSFVRSSITIMKNITGKMKVAARYKPHPKTATKTTKYNMFLLSVF